MNRKKLYVSTDKALPSFYTYRDIIKKIYKWFTVVYVSETWLNLSQLWEGAKQERRHRKQGKTIGMLKAWPCERIWRNQHVMENKHTVGIAFKKFQTE